MLVILMEDSRKQFVDWWLTAGYGKDSERHGNLHWDGKKTSEIWQSFEQVAHEKTGQPKILTLFFSAVPKTTLVPAYISGNLNCALSESLFTPNPNTE